MADTKKNIALILPSMSHSVEHSVCVGAEAGLAGSHTQLVYLSVGWIEPKSEHLGYANRIHQSVNFKQLDGVLIYGAGITNRSERSAIRGIINCYPQIPLINIGDVVADVPSVVFKNEPVFTELVKHLVVDKQCKKIAFLNGPTDNYDAQTRRNAVIQALAKHQLELDEKFNWPGQFSFGSGSFAVKRYFQQHTERPDAIICANDLMAIGVVNELLRMGIRVPDDIKVTGFDDLEYTKKIDVPLTTGRYPIFNMSQAAAKLMLNWFEGASPPAIYSVDSSVVYRQSTGEQGDVRSQIALSEAFAQKQFSRDSNSDRLLISRAINRIHDVPTILNMISSLFYDVGGRQLHYLRFDAKQQQLVQVYSLDGNELTITEQPEAPFQPLDLASLIAKSNEPDTQWVISPVGLEEFYFGYVLVEVVAEEADLPEYLANELCKRLENIELAADSENLRDHMIKTEQMATMGRLVSGLAHEINTPLGISLVAASNLADEIFKLKRQIAAGKMTKSAFDEFIDMTNESQKMIFNSLKRTADLVASFKKVSVDQHVEAVQKLNLASYLDEVLLSLKPRIKRSGAKVSTDFDTNIEMKTHAGTWAQVLTNLLLNAFIHAFEDEPEDAKVSLSLQRQEDFVVFIVQDNGKGIAKNKQKLIYDPFFTTRRAKGGTGLGLNIVYNMVTQKLNGSIHLESKSVEEYEQHGTQFIVKVPL